MDVLIESAVRSALTQAFCVDGDCVKLPEFEALAKSVKLQDNGAVDEASLSQAVKQMAALKPNLFNPPKPWDEITDPMEFAEREKQLRESLRPRPVVQSNEFANLDSSRCTEDEMEALRRVLGNRGSGYDRGILRGALARQLAQDAALTPRDAA